MTDWANSAFGNTSTSNQDHEEDQTKAKPVEGFGQVWGQTTDANVNDEDGDFDDFQDGGWASNAWGTTTDN